MELFFRSRWAREGERERVRWIEHLDHRITLVCLFLGREDERVGEEGLLLLKIEKRGHRGNLDILKNNDIDTVQPELGTWGFFSYFVRLKMLFLALSKNWFWRGAGYFIWTGQSCALLAQLWVQPAGSVQQYKDVQQYKMYNSTTCTTVQHIQQYNMYNSTTCTVQDILPIIALSRLPNFLSARIRLNRKHRSQIRRLYFFLNVGERPSNYRIVCTFNWKGCVERGQKENGRKFCVVSVNAFILEPAKGSFI